MPPNIFHNNGQYAIFKSHKPRRLNLGPIIALLLEKQLYRDKKMAGHLHKPADLDIVLCTTRAEKQYTERILEHLGIEDFTVLGRHLSAWKHVYKLSLIVEHIRNHPKPDFLIHLDAPDTLVIGDLQSSIDCFRSEFDCDLLFGAEKNSAPGSRTTRTITPPETDFLARIETFEESNYPPPFQHLNAGCFIGRKDFILEVFSQALQTRKHMGLSSRLGYGGYLYDDDQLVTRELHRNHYPRIQIDHENRIFQNLYAINMTEMSARYPVRPGARFAGASLSYLARILSRKLKSLTAWPIRRQL